MSLGDKIGLAVPLNTIKDMADFLVTVSWVGIPNAATALDYFLTSGERGKTSNVYSLEEGVFKKGHTMREINIASAINNSNDMKQDFENTIETLKYVAEEFCHTDGVPITFTNIFESSGKVEDNKDWKNAMHYYRIKIKCKAIKNGDDFTMDLRYGIIDYYDWDLEPIDYEDDLSGFTKESKQLFINNFYMMNMAGMARNYTNYGEYNVRVLWNK